MADEIDRAEALGLLGVVLHPGCYTAGQRSRRPRSHRRWPAGAARRRDAAARRWSSWSTPPDRARRSARRSNRSRTSSQDQRSPPHRRLPGHLSPAGIGLRHRVAGRVCGHVRPVRAADWHRPAQGLPSERFEAAARQPGRSSRAHRSGLRSGSKHFGASSTIAASTGCRCCSKRPKQKAALLQ